MRFTLPSLTLALLLSSCGGSSPEPASAPDAAGPAGDNSDAPGEGAETPVEAPTAATERQFDLKDSDSARDARGAGESKIKATRTEAAVKFIVVDKEKDAPISGVVISLTSEDGGKFFTEETDETGYAEVLVPVGQQYALVYLSLGKKDISATVPVSNEPNQNIKLTLRYKNNAPKPRAGQADGPGFVLNGVTFDTAKATIKAESFPRLDGVVEYMTHKKSARIRIVGHTDNEGDPQANKRLSENRAKACRDYLVRKGIEGDRIETAGYGDQQPVAANDTPEGRQQNRRIEAKEL